MLDLASVLTATPTSYERFGTRSRPKSNASDLGGKDSMQRRIQMITAEGVFFFCKQNPARPEHSVASYPRAMDLPASATSTNSYLES